MRALPTGIQSLINRRDGIIVHQLFLLAGRNRTTNAIENIGIWSGADHQIFTLTDDGASTATTFYGAGNFLAMSDLQTEQGLTIRRLALNMSPFSTEMQTVLREYDPKFMPVKIYLAFFDPDNMTLVSDPWRVWKGWVDTAPIRNGAKGEQSQATINTVGHTRILTRVAPAKRSNETQKLRSNADTFYSSVAITGTINTPWGTTQ